MKNDHRKPHSLNEFGKKTLLIAPSILAADFTKLGSEIQDVVAAGANIIHVDVMDGHFVPNISIGPPVVEKIRTVTDRVFDVHLMLSQPHKYVDAFHKAGADHITIHTEAESDVSSTLARIHELGCTAGICLKPATPAEALKPYLDQIEMVLVMTVEPGFGGQSFMADMLPKIREVRKMINDSNRNIHLEVDGGIGQETAPLAIEAGANILVAGTSVFRAKTGMAKAMATLLGHAPCPAL